MLEPVSPLIRTALVFGLILIALRRRLSLGSAFLIGSVGLSIVFGLGMKSALESAMSSILYGKTLSLAVIVTLILILSDSMERAGQMQRMLDGFRGLVRSQRLNLILFPALIGLLPMPGGAVFSAPMVKTLGRDTDLSGPDLSFINYWFRHIWEYWWPMYPGVLLGAIIADVNLLSFVCIMLPLSISAFFLGRGPLMKLAPSNGPSGGPARPDVAPFLQEMLPILVVIVVGLGAGGLLVLTMPDFGLGKETGLIFSLCLAIIWVWYGNRLTGREVGLTMKNPQLIKMVYMVFAILVFKGILIDSNGVSAISDELSRLHIPLVLVAVFLPFIVGMLTGITIAFVGATFPILIPLIQSHGDGPYLLAYMMVAMVTGFAGVLLSPLHLCLILSNEYFQAASGQVYRRLWKPCLFLMLVGIGYFWVLYGMFRYNGVT